MAGLVDIVTSVPELAQNIAQVAASDPISAVLVAVGALIFAGTVGLTTVLAVGAVISAVTPDLSGGQPPRAR